MKGAAADKASIAPLTVQLTTLQEKHRRLTISNEIDRLYTEQGAVGLNVWTGQDLTIYQVSIPADRLINRFSDDILTDWMGNCEKENRISHQ